MLDITGARAQPPMRSHWKLRPGPQSHKNSKQQCKRHRANTHPSSALRHAARLAVMAMAPRNISKHCLAGASLGPDQHSQHAQHKNRSLLNEYAI